MDKRTVVVTGGKRGLVPRFARPFWKGAAKWLRWTRTSPEA